MELGRAFEREMREQPEHWRAIAQRADLDALAAQLVAPLGFLGSGSSSFVGDIAAYRARSRSIAARSFAASELCYEGRPHVATLVAISQSGRSRDVLEALDDIDADRIVAITSDVQSPLGLRADNAFALDVGNERAIPATKTVTGSLALLLAALHPADRSALRTTADQVEAWLADEHAVSPVIVDTIASADHVIVLGSGLGLGTAREVALKLKEATYLPAEAQSTGEFTHGALAVLHAGSAVIGIGGDDAANIRLRALFARAAESEARRITIGVTLPGVLRVGAHAIGDFEPLSAIVSAQYLALAVGRARGIDSDTPRGTTKIVS